MIADRPGLDEPEWALLCRQKFEEMVARDLRQMREDYERRWLLLKEAGKALEVSVDDS
jgi:hypothetical protein